MESNRDFVIPSLKISKSFTEYLNNQYTYETELDQLFNLTLKGFIIGDWGSGKTTILKQLEKKSNKHLNREVIYISLSKVIDSKENIEDIVRGRTKSSGGYFENVIVLFDDIENVPQGIIQNELYQFLNKYKDLAAYIAVTPRYLKEHPFLTELKDMQYVLISNSKVPKENISYWAADIDLIASNKQKKFHFNDQIQKIISTKLHAVSRELINQVKQGDYFLFKEISKNNSLQVFNLGQVIDIHGNNDEIFLLSLDIEQYEYKINWDNDINWNTQLIQITEKYIIDKLFLDKINSIKLNKANNDLKNDLVRKGNLQHKYTNPNNHNVADQLEVSKDIKAFASLLAFKNATPPIAIGLFGNWGSGKSYFMTNIRKEIEELVITKNSDYCERIVHVEFNSWFYRDADLWSSLVAKIFTELHSFLTPNGENQSVDSFYQNLSSVKEDLAIMNDELNKILLSKALLESELQQIILDKNKKAESLSSTPLNKIIDAIINEPFVKSEIDKINQDLDIKLGSSIKDINKNITQLTSFYDKIIATLKTVTNKNKNFAIFVLVAIIFTLLIPAIYSSLEDQIGTITTWIIRSSLFLTSIIAYLRPAFNKINSAYKRLKGLSKTWESLVEKEKLKISEDEEKLKEEIQIIEKDIDVFQSKINVADDKIRLINKEISDIKSGKKLKDFVSARNSDERYKSKLGVISWVREDFEELDKLIRRNKEVNNLDNKRNIIINDDIKIDRIILYIDDLDRCPEDRVVEVLEAVHLLLSFELFGVVVGVDPRWVSHALNQKYKGLLQGNFDNTKNLKQNNEHLYKYNATTYDYLEKIFQIPFALLPIEVKGAQNLLSSYLQQNNNQEENDKKNNFNKENENQKNNKKASSRNESESSINKKSHEEDKAIISIDSKKFIITNEEISHILEYASIIGNTPRTIQRFVNVYRIIRAHPNVMLPDTFSVEHKYIIGYLALVIGLPNTAVSITKLILLSENSSSTLIQLLDKTEHQKDILRIKLALTAETFNDFKAVKSKQLTEWALLVSRFSFRATEIMQ